jgi:hypothetical protein
MNSTVITYSGKDYQLRPTFMAASEIQKRCGKTLAQAVFSARSLSITDLQSIMCSAFIGNGYDIDERKAGDELIADYATTETKLINQVLEYGQAFFPQVENDGTKKPQAMTEQAG